MGACVVEIAWWGVCMDGEECGWWGVCGERRRCKMWEDRGTYYRERSYWPSPVGSASHHATPGDGTGGSEQRMAERAGYHLHSALTLTFFFVAKSLSSLLKRSRSLFRLSKLACSYLHNNWSHITCTYTKLALKQACFKLHKVCILWLSQSLIGKLLVCINWKITWWQYRHCLRWYPVCPSYCSSDSWGESDHHQVCMPAWEQLCSYSHIFDKLEVDQ